MIKLVIVDDHTLFREGLASIIQLEPDIEVSGLAGTVQEAVDIVRSLKPDMVLMDFTLPDGNGAEATRLVLNEHPDCKIIFLTMSDSDENLFAAIRSGAKGYLIKNMSPAKLVATIRSVQRGESALSRRPREASRASRHPDESRQAREYPGRWQGDGGHPPTGDQDEPAGAATAPDAGANLPAIG